MTQIFACVNTAGRSCFLSPFVGISDRVRLLQKPFIMSPFTLYPFIVELLNDDWKTRSLPLSQLWAGALWQLLQVEALVIVTVFFF